MRSVDSTREHDSDDLDGERGTQPERLERRRAAGTGAPATTDAGGAEGTTAARSFGDAVTAGVHPTQDPVIARAIAGGGRPLEAAVRARLERTLRADLGAVRIHDDTYAAAAAAQQGAEAFALGHDIVFAHGKYDPHTPAGEWLLAHEVQHTIQTNGTATEILKHGPGVRGGSTREDAADAAAGRTGDELTERTTQASLLRARLGARQAELHATTETRTAMERDDELATIAHAQALLGSPSGPPSSATLARLESEHRDRVAASPGRAPEHDDTITAATPRVLPTDHERRVERTSQLRSRIDTRLVELDDPAEHARPAASRDAERTQLQIARRALASRTEVPSTSALDQLEAAQVRRDDAAHADRQARAARMSAQLDQRVARMSTDAARTPEERESEREAISVARAQLASDPSSATLARLESEHAARATQAQQVEQPDEDARTSEHLPRISVQRPPVPDPVAQPDTEADRRTRSFGATTSQLEVTETTIDPGATAPRDSRITVGDHTAGARISEGTGSDRRELGGSATYQDGALDLSGSARVGAITGTVGSGDTYRSHAPMLMSDGRYRVTWTIEHRDSAGMTGSSDATVQHDALGTVDSASVGASGRVSSTRTGTEVFATMAEATQFHTEFEAHAASAAERTSVDTAHTPSFWTSAQPGTTRSVANAGTITPSGAVTLDGLLNVGVECTFRASREVSVTKADAENLEATRTVHCEAAPRGSLGAGGISVGISHTSSHEVTIVVGVRLGSTAMDRLLGGIFFIDGTEDGARVIRTTTDDRSGWGETVAAGALLRLGGGSTTGTTTSQTFDADGNPTTHTTEHAREDFTGGTVLGDYSQHHVDSAASDDGALATTADFHTTSGAESGQMLADATGVARGLDPEAASSGHWEVSSQLSPDQMIEFHRRFIARPVEPTDSGIYANLRSQLASIPTEATPAANASRARVLTAFLSSEGQTGLAIIQGVAHVEPEHFLRLFATGGQDPNFMGAGETQALETRIAQYREAAASHHAIDHESEIVTDLHAMKHGLEAIADQSHYTDLPRELRQQQIERYRGFVGQLQSARDACSVDGDVQTAETMGADTQEACHVIEVERRAASTLRGEASVARDRVYAQRQYFGQEGRAHGEVPLPAAIAARTLVLWHEGEAATGEGNFALHDAEGRLGTVRGTTDELAIQRVYRDATPLLQRAAGDFERATQAFAEANALYANVGVGAMAPMLPDQATEAVAPFTPAPTPTPTVEQAPTPTRHDRHAHPTGGVDASAPVPEVGPRHGVIVSACLAPHLHFVRLDPAGLSAEARVTGGRVTMPSGLIVEVIGAELVTVLSDAINESLGERHMYTVELRIAGVIPGATSFIVPTLVSGVPSNIEIDNRIGGSFSALVAC